MDSKCIFGWIFVNEYFKNRLLYITAVKRKRNTQLKKKKILISEGTHIV